MILGTVLLATAAVAGGRDFYPREYTIRRGADWDADGVPDLLLGLNGYVAGPDTLTVRDAGKVHLLSGKDGHVIRTIRGDRRGAQFGAAVLLAQDWNADGVPDIWIGAPGHASTWSTPAPDDRPGAIHLCSGKDGSTIKTLRWKEPFDDAGGELLSIGDVDSDGYEDIVVGSESRRHVAAVSTKLGTVLWTLEADAWVHGDRLGRIADMDGDGASEVVLGLFARDEVEGLYTGRILVVSGRSGKELKCLRGSDVLSSKWAFSGEFSVTRDAANRPRIIARCQNRSRPDRTAIFLVSIEEGTATGPVAFTTEQGRTTGEGDTGASLGTSTCGLPDLDADGVEDFAVSAPHWRGPGYYIHPWAAMFVVSGKSLEMRARLPATRYEDCSCFGDEIGDAGDLDSDGVTDIFCSTWLCEDCTGRSSNRLQVCSGATLKCIWEIDLKRLE